MTEPATATTSDALRPGGMGGDHYAWCTFRANGTDSDDCGPQGQFCVGGSATVPLVLDGQVPLVAKLTTTDDELGPAISLSDGTPVAGRANWLLDADEATTLAHYLLAMACQLRRTDAR